ncbi:MAG: CorA family divalent cation transporter [Candidatus Altiarchaeota archaeon]
MDTNAAAPIVLKADAPRRAFCVAMQKDNKPVRVEGESSADFTTLLEESDVAWVNFVVDDINADGEAIATSLGFSQNLVSTLLTGFRSNYEDRDVELGIMIPAVDTERLEVTIHPLVILIKRGLILTIHGKNISRLVKFSRYANTFMKKIKQNIPWQDKMTILLWRIMDENNSKNFDHLREIEEQADELAKDMMNPMTPRDKLGPDIYRMKHALIIYLDSLWATLDVIHTLRYGDAEVLSDNSKILERISVLASDVTSQISISEHMSEVLASGLEVLQTIYNNQLQMLNNRLALLATWLAIIGTAVLVPNTLATIFGIPTISEHLDWRLTILILIASTLLSAWIAYWAIRAKGLIPKSVE